MSSYRGWVRESPRGQNAHESIWPRPELNPQGCKKGYGFSGGIKPLKHDCKVVRFCSQVHERMNWWKRLFDHLRGAKL
jgi:hypothetical protein